MKYYLDTEFNGFGGTLLSLALVREDGRSFYVVDEMPGKWDPWVEQNVRPILFAAGLPPASADADASPGSIQGWYGNREERGFRYYQCLGEDIAEFLKGDPAPHVIADWPDDIRYLCAELITGPGEMVNIPGITFEVVRVDAYPTKLLGAVQHNAWWDAMALRAKLSPGSGAMAA